MANWILVRATFDPAPADWALAHGVFADHGISGTVQEDRPPALGGYLYEPTDEELSVLERALIEFGAASVERSVVPEEDWSEYWKQFFVPRRIGERFVVRPTWEEYESNPGDLVIVLDPGQAFGTGDHPTTRMCLELMERVDFSGKSVADIGCGSGILSVGACMLGAESVVGIEIERASCEAAVENATRNAVTYQVHEGKGFEPLPEAETFDIVLSNIISAALIQLSPVVSVRVKPSGTWLVSGIIDSNWPDVQAAANRVGFTLIEERQEGEWVAATFVRG